MTFKNTILHKLLFRRNDFCCLCFNTLIKDDYVQIDDGIIFNGDTISMADIITFVVPTEVPLNIATNGLCTKCTKQAITSYKFMKMCKENWEMLSNTIETLSACIEYNKNENNFSQTLLITLDTKEFSSERHYDKKRVFNANKLMYEEAQAPLDRNNLSDCLKHENLSKDESKVLQKNHFRTPTRVKLIKNKHSPLNSPSISEMLYDKNDSKNFKCKICYHIYPTLSNLKHHFVRVHAPKIFKCPDCQRQYGSAWILEQHRYESHSNLVCSHCGKKYNNRQSLKAHEMGHRIKWVCQSCGRNYKRRSTYNKHVRLGECNRPRMSSSEAKFTCDICEKKFCQKSSLRVHITFEHGKGKAYECMWCQKKFYAQSKLNAHIVKHTKDKKFSCLQCGGKFVTKESLLYHTRIHTGDKPYKCDICDERFLSASRRLEHVKRKHNVHIYECEICHSKFKLKSWLLKHQKKHFNPLYNVLLTDSGHGGRSTRDEPTAQDTL